MLGSLKYSCMHADHIFARTKKSRETLEPERKRETLFLHGQKDLRRRGVVQRRGRRGSQRVAVRRLEIALILEAQARIHEERKIVPSLTRCNPGNGT
jgi:hypothetical protein